MSRSPASIPSSSGLSQELLAALQAVLGGEEARHRAGVRGDPEPRTRTPAFRWKELRCQSLERRTQAKPNSLAFPGLLR